MEHLPLIEIGQMLHRGERRIWLRYPRIEQVDRIVRALEHRRWSATRGCWHIPIRDNYLQYLYDQFHGIAKIQHEGLNRKSGTVFLAKSPSENLLYVKLPFHEEMIKYIKTRNKAWFYPNSRLWSLPLSRENIDFMERMCNYYQIPIQLRSTFVRKGTVNRKFREKVSNYLPSRFFEQLRLENKSKKTEQLYASQLNHLIHAMQGRMPEEISSIELQKYLLDLIEVRGFSRATQNLIVSALKAYHKAMGIPFPEPEELPRPKTGYHLPQVLSKEEVKNILKGVTNPKHLFALKMIYGFGLRISELLQIQLDDIYLDRNQLLIRNSKGMKDRVLPISSVQQKDIRSYLKRYLPENYLLEGLNGSKYSGSSIRCILKRRAKELGLSTKRVTPHKLRHSYATHQLERGVDVRFIQELLGHKNLKTTEIYTHISKTKLEDIGSPIDDFED